ncbi:casparian strip membrane protein 2-like [Telopea speciosissima]|uniref:casparian strip membrane protein 2-like n=1 Tax=Telopea speciosissima TaxID=54955 RepID=UPI001CC577D0|nr:casparian strip membrane protein 2-like [Telopea speciosissima]
MKSGEGEATTIVIGEATVDTKGKSSAAAPVVATTKSIKSLKSINYGKGEWKKGIAVFDFLIRLIALAATLTGAIVMGSTNQTLPFFTQSFQFRATYSDFPPFTLFVVANAVASGYLVLSLPFSIASIVRPNAGGPRLLLLILDTVMVGITSAGAAAAAAIVYLAHDGNPNANWLPICRQFNSFCDQISGAVVASFVAAVILMLLVAMSALALRKH